MAKQIEVFKNKRIIAFLQLTKYCLHDNLDIFKKYEAGFITLKNNISISVYDSNFTQKIYNIYPKLMKKYLAIYHKKLVMYIISISYLSNYIISNNNRWIVRISDNYRIKLSDIKFINKLQLELSYDLTDLDNIFNKREYTRQENLALLQWLYNDYTLDKDEYTLHIYDENKQPIVKLFSMYDENLEHIVRTSYYYINDFKDCTPPGIDYHYYYRIQDEVLELITEAKNEYKMYTLTGKLKNNIFLQWFKKMIIYVIRSVNAKDIINIAKYSKIIIKY